MSAARPKISSENASPTTPPSSPALMRIRARRRASSANNIHDSAAKRKRYQLDKMIACGKEGEIWLVFDTENAVDVVMKRILHKVLRTDSGREENVYIGKCILEPAVGMKLSHPGLVRTLDTFHDGTYFCLVREFVDGVELFDWVTAMHEPELFPETNVPESMARTIIKQLIDVVCYLHTSGVAHRDIKPENIIIAFGNIDGPVIKLIDLGMVHIANEDSAESRMTNILKGSIEYVPPEVMRCEQPVDPFACDVWAVGSVAFIVATGWRPFEFPLIDLSLAQALPFVHTLTRDDFPEWLSYHDSFYRLIEAALEMCSDKRPTIHALAESQEWLHRSC